ncbi:MAG: patatin-like phospholipase family protein [Gammaproteobacteria bacterium]|nr:patatin-like phospholipase family protein [Gammaproteobacteria bacterium]MDH5651648.1 patatin-like phospholipase family protein [Gammaproteobacteria bacterium]
MANKHHETRVGIILTGGGARAAYQVGVLKAIADILPRDAANPFKIITGSSAGAINAAALACYSANYRDAVRRILQIWANFRSNHVYRTDLAGIAGTGARWLASMFVGGLGKNNPHCLLNRAPLRALLEKYIHTNNIQEAVDKGYIHALSVSASGYSSHQSVSFFHAHPSVESWARSRRVGSRSPITIDHLMASSAIPFLFEAIKVHREFFGDGSMRQIAPLSPALHLGADRILVIGNRQEDNFQPKRVSNPPHPSLGQIAGHALDSIFLDSLEADLERLQRINRTVDLIPEDTREEHGIALRKVEVMVISPSQDMGEIAVQYTDQLPRTIRFLLRGLGASKKNGSSLISYLLFEKGYTRALIDLGYQDATQKKAEILDFLSGKTGAEVKPDR